MYDISHKTTFIVRFNQVLLCFFIQNMVIAQTSRLRSNSYHLLDNQVIHIINEGSRRNDEDSLKTEENTGYELEYNIMYEYDSLLSEYYFGDVKLNSNITGHQQKKVLPIIYLSRILKNKTLERSYSSGFLNNIRIQREISKLKVKRLLEIVKIWFLVYIALAIPLWCTKGWCCCCLLCNFFKPNKIIKEAKIFLETNPPGVFRYRGGVIYYEPSDNEKDCYEKLDHLIRTI